MSHQIPLREVRMAFARSSGAGGQNVNKTSTKVTVWWPIGASPSFTGEEKNRIRAKLGNKINWQDELMVTAEAQRSQAQNRASAISRLQTLVAHAVRIPKPRRATRPSRASKLRRLECKKLHARKKFNRKILNLF